MAGSGHEIAMILPEKDAGEERLLARIRELEQENRALRESLKSQEELAAVLLARRELDRQVLEQTRQIVFDFDVAAGRVTRSGACEAVTGYTSEEFSALDFPAWLEGIHHEDREVVAPKVQNALEMPGPYEFEYRYRRRDGSYVFLCDKGVSLADESGRVRRVLGTMSDVSERKLAELERQKLALLLEMTQDYVVVATLDGTITYLNNAARTMVGLGPEEGIGRNLTDFFSSSHWHQLNKTLYLSLLNEGVQRFESSYRDFETGASFPVEVSAFLIKDPSGVPLFLGTVARDLTKQKRIEGELLRSRDQYLQLFEHFPSLVWRSGTDGGCDYVNATWLEFTGRQSEEEFGEGWMQGIHPADLDRCVTAYRRAFERRITFEVEYRLRRHDGSYRWVVSRGTPYLDPDGNFAGFIGSCYDISEQKKFEFEQRLMRSERDLLTEKLQLVLDRMPIGCILCDPYLVVTYWNQAAETIFGFSADESVGTVVAGIVVPEKEREQFDAVVEVLRSAQTPVAGVYRNLTKSGALIMCEWHNMALRDSDGSVAGYILMALDITERIRSQEALKESEQIQQELNRSLSQSLTAVEDALSARIGSERALLASQQELKKVNSELKGILDAVEESIILFSRDLEVIWSNRGASANILPGSPGAEAAARPDLPDSILVQIRDCFHTGARFADQIVRNNGQIWDIRGYPIFDEKGEVQSVLKVASDVTVKIGQQERTIRSAHLAALGELAAGVAHEINNPAHGIMNYAEHLIRKFPGETRTLDICSRIIKESERIAHIVKALLDFSRKTDGGKIRVRVEGIIDEALTLCKSQLRKDNIRLFLDQQDELPEVLADPQQIVQVILNLISNSRYSLNARFPDMDTNKSIAVSVCSARAGGESWIRVAIADQGGGIPQHILHKVLNPFFTTKPSGMGTGLGLSICNTIIADHGGKLEIESTEGESTTVSFLLPVWSKNAI